MLVTGGYRAGSAMIKIQKKADGSYDVAELFKNPDFGSHTQPPILYKDHFYVQYTTNERSDGLVCMTMDGQVKWKTGEEPPFNKGGAVLADGLLLATDGNTKLYLIEPDPSASSRWRVRSCSNRPTTGRRSRSWMASCSSATRSS